MSCPPQPSPTRKTLTQEGAHPAGWGESRAQEATPQQWPRKDSESGALVAYPPQVWKALAPAVRLTAGTLGQSPGPRPAPAAAAATGTAAAAATGAAAAAPVLVDGDLDLGSALRRAAGGVGDAGWLRAAPHPARLPRDSWYKP